MPEKFPWKKISSEVVCKNPWWEYRKDILSVGEETMEYHYVHTPGAVCVVPVTEEGKIIIMKHPRYLLQKNFWEFPGGGMKEGQAPEDAACAEVCEEIGYEVKKLISLGSIASWAGVSDEICHLFLAYMGEAVGVQREPLERGIEVVVKDKEEVDALMRGRVYWNAPSVSAWFMARNLLWQQHEGQKTRITVDGIVVNRKKEILMEKRQIEPFKGCWVLPGGHVEYNETLKKAVVREVKEETGLDAQPLWMVGVYSEPGKDRDPRGHVVSTCYALEVKGGRLKKNQESSQLKWFDPFKLPRKIGFKHDVLVRDYIKQVKQNRSFFEKLGVTDVLKKIRGLR